MKVILESPYAGDVQKNIEYARRCMADCLKRGEYPFASHLLYTQEGILDDNIPEERDLGMLAGHDWAKHADKTVVYIDLGVTPGMIRGINHAHACKRKVVFRHFEPRKSCLKEELKESINS